MTEAEPDTFVVMWRGGPDAPWQVQPHIYSAREAVAVGRQLLEQFRGCVFTTRVQLPAWAPA
jgi:hypothetical protein